MGCYTCQLFLLNSVLLNALSFYKQSTIILLQMNVTSQLVFSANINNMLHQADCIRRQNCFLFYHLGNPQNGPTAWQALSTFSAVIGLKKAKIQVKLAT